MLLKEYEMADKKISRHHARIRVTYLKPECCDKVGVCNPIATSFGDECGNVGCTKIGY